MSLEEQHPTSYEICVQGHLDPIWRDLFEGMAMNQSYLPDGRPKTTLLGPVADQSGLQGFLLKLSKINLTLISVNPKKPKGGESEQEQ
jgi:hypothetical protein